MGRLCQEFGCAGLVRAMRLGLCDRWRQPSLLTPDCSSSIGGALSAADTARRDNLSLYQVWEYTLLHSRSYPTSSICNERRSRAFPLSQAATARTTVEALTLKALAAIGNNKVTFSSFRAAVYCTALTFFSSCRTFSAEIDHTLLLGRYFLRFSTTSAA